MSDLDRAQKFICEHHWITHVRGGHPLTVSICSQCGNPDWADLKEQAERLRANQLPDGGTWDVEYGHQTTEVGWIGEPRGLYYASNQRRVWRGPAERVQEAPATPDPDSDTQTTP